MSFLQQIRQTLETHLNSLSALNGMTIYWENRSVTQTQRVTALRAFLERSSIAPSAIGPNSPLLHEGLLNLDILGATNKPIKDQEELASDLLIAFESGITIVNEDNANVRVHIRKTNVLGGVVSPPFYVIPVTVEWYCYEHRN